MDMTVYITTYALTKGIIKVKGGLSAHKEGHFRAWDYDKYDGQITAKSSRK